MLVSSFPNRKLNLRFGFYSKSATTSQSAALTAPPRGEPRDGGTESLSHGCAVPAPVHKGAKDEKNMKKWKGSMKMNADTFYGICTINYPPPGVGNGGAR